LQRQKSLFYKKIKCHCGANFKKVQEREYVAYICGNYANYRECRRLAIHENILLEFISRYCEGKKIEFVKDNDFIDSILNYIYVHEDESLEFIYNDGHHQIFSDNLIKY
jgi:NAD(P)H-flavin reductase